MTTTRDPLNSDRSLTTFAMSMALPAATTMGNAANGPPLTCTSAVALSPGVTTLAVIPVPRSSLARLRALPDETRVYFGHEYTETNLRFALTLEPGNEALRGKYEWVLQRNREHQPTTPTTIASEKQTNPFFRSHSSELRETLRRQFPDLAFSPYVTSAVLSRSGDQMEGGYLFGVDFAQEAKVNRILAEGLKHRVPGEFEVMIGKTLKEQFMLAEGDKLTYIFTQMEPGGLALTPKIKRFENVTTFDSGLSAYDKGFSYTTLSSLQKVLGVPENLYDGIHVHSENPEADIIRIAAALPETVAVRGWWEDNGNFFAALEMEKTALFIVLMLIILIAAINIISSLLMTVMNRRSEIALLISLGASKQEVKKVFLILGIVIGALGILTGTILGFLGMWILGTFEIISLPADVYPTSTLPLDLSVIDFFSIIVGAFVIAAIFTPPDVVSQFMLAMPLWLLYELGLFLARFVNVPKKDEEAEEATAK